MSTAKMPTITQSKASTAEASSGPMIAAYEIPAGIENAETKTSKRMSRSHIILRRVSGITMYHARGGRSLSSISRTSSYTSSSSFSEYSFPILFLCACRLATIAPFPDASAFSSLADDGVYPAAFLPAEKLVGRDGSVCVRRPASGAGAPPEKLVGREAPPPPVAAFERWCCSTASSVGGMVAPAPPAQVRELQRRGRRCAGNRMRR